MKSVIPAEAGIQSGPFPQHLALIKKWMPAFAGMTQKETDPLPGHRMPSGTYCTASEDVVCVMA